MSVEAIFFESDANENVKESYIVVEYGNDGFTMTLTIFELCYENACVENIFFHK